MLELTLGHGGAPVPRLLVLGAHPDDIEIGCSGAVLELVGGGGVAAVTWVVFSGEGGRDREARESAEAILAGVTKKEVVVASFRDGFFPGQSSEIKELFETLKTGESPSLILTHWRQDLHQDHRLIGELTWQTFRDHLVLEYEIPKYDGDLGTPNVFVPLRASTCRRKVNNLLDRFQSQRQRRWFAPDVFFALMRMRGVESNAPSGYAEAFYGRKLTLGWEGRPAVEAGRPARIQDAGSVRP
jgi:LmbE family N-acetylglucosaminyl deacetylase